MTTALKQFLKYKTQSTSVEENTKRRQTSVYNPCFSKDFIPNMERKPKQSIAKNT